MSNAISNDNLKNYRDGQDTTGFLPKLEYEYDAVAKEVDVVSKTEFPAGKYLKKVILHVHDKFGGTVHGEITEQPGSGVADDVTIDVETLNLSKPLDITATVILTGDHLVADGGAYDIGVAGELSNWNINWRA